MTFELKFGLKLLRHLNSNIQKMWNLVENFRKLRNREKEHLSVVIHLLLSSGSFNFTCLLTYHRPILPWVKKLLFVCICSYLFLPVLLESNTSFFFLSMLFFSHLYFRPFSLHPRIILVDLSQFPLLDFFLFLHLSLYSFSSHLKIFTLQAVIILLNCLFKTHDPLP